MSEVTFSFIIQGDSEGYVTFECPFCESEFKLQAGEIQSDDNPILELFCPYCGLTSEKDTFYSKETIEKAKELAMNYEIEELNKKFGQISRNLNSSSKGVVTMTFKPLQKVNVRELKERDTTEEVFTCNCCEQHVKVCIVLVYQKSFVRIVGWIFNDHKRLQGSEFGIQKNSKQYANDGCRYC